LQKAYPAYTQRVYRNNRLPSGVTEYRIPVEFKDKLKTEGLKVFQSLMFSAGDAYDLWWTGQEFKDMRVEACAQMLEHDPKVFERFRNEKFDLAIAHFHDLCPLAIARKIGIEKSITASGAVGQNEPDLWDLSKNVPALLINGERMLDFPRPLPIHISFSGELGLKKPAKKVDFDDNLQTILQKPSEGLIVFSLGTVSNTTNMPQQMIKSFVGAFAMLSDYTILWRMEGKVDEAIPLKHVHLLKWLPQKDIMKLPNMKLLIAHGGYNSFLETAQAGVPAVLMPLFADQKINAMRAQRFGIARVLDKLNLTPEIVYEAITDVLGNETYTTRARKLSMMLTDKPTDRPYSSLNYILKLATSNAKYFTLRAAQHLSFYAFYSLDLIAILGAVVIVLSMNI
uniref:UDP-glucuronosyltransferase n=1 Tax=Haemonchus placei TaxID=6290 RepID=A0A0N4X2K8_HAEPC